VREHDSVPITVAQAVAGVMATNRKLQAEIDRTLKKVEEGLDLFNEIWDKVYAAQNMAQRDKFETDLKSQIKKLQRLRDQIKVWQADSSIKDKSKIDSARKKIEEKMEAFKVCERETKTKAFSKEGLAQDRADPLERSKNEVREWVRDCIEKLKVQIEEREADIEAAVSNVKKKKVDHAAVDNLREKINRHRYHIEMLERILRALDNDAVECEEVNEIRESVEYYVDANTEDDFVEDEGIYEALTLEVPVEIQPPHGAKGKEETDNPPEQKPAEPDNLERKEPEPKRKLEETGRKQREVSVSTTTAPGNLDDVRKKRDAVDAVRPPSDQEPSTLSIREDGASAAVVGQDAAAAVGAPRPRNIGIPTTSAWANQQQPVAALLSKQSAGHSPGMVGESSSLGATTPTLSTTTPSSMASATPRLPPGFESVANALGAAVGGKTSLSEFAPFESSGTTASTAHLPSSTSGMGVHGSLYQTRAGDRLGLLLNSGRGATTTSNTATAMSNLLPGYSMPPTSGQAPENDLFSAEQLPIMAPEDTNHERAAPISLNHIGAGSDVASSDRISSRSMLMASRQLDEATHYLNAPSTNSLPLGSSGANTLKASSVPPPRVQPLYEPRNPFPVHSSFPQIPLNALENPEFYERLDIDPLFFVFFFPQRPKHQLLAARELKRQAWRFHKRYLTWFQRHEEPRVTTDEYESGSYVYFDSQMWCQRVKQDFVFSYADLEDELPIA
jgi:CCR4-NOT transcription complex subunit 3